MDSSSKSTDLKLKNDHFYKILILFTLCVVMASLHTSGLTWMEGFSALFRIMIYIIAIDIIEIASNFIYIFFVTGTLPIQDLLEQLKKWKYVMFISAISFFVYFNHKIIDANFLILTIALAIYNSGYAERYTKETIRKKFISYGVGMACNFYEGYLIHVLPNDGTQFGGFETNIQRYESRQGVIFPVKRLFLIITKKLYCPPDLAEFNKTNKDLPYLEACLPLDDVSKDVAGVKNRTYRNSAYKIYRPQADPVYLVAECVTPLHTLQKVKERRAEYKELADADFDVIVGDFCKMLQSIIDNSRNCYQKCELVFYDDTNPDLNLADVLLERISQIEPSFEK